MTTRKVFRGADLEVFHEQIGNFRTHLEIAMETGDDKECERLLKAIGGEMVKASELIQKLIEDLRL